MVLQTQLVSVIGRLFDGSEWYLPGFGIIMALANFQIDGKSPVSQLKTLECWFRMMFDKLVVDSVGATRSVMCRI